MPKQNHFFVGVGNNCRETLTAEPVEATDKDGNVIETWTEIRKKWTLDWFGDEHVEKCGAQITQDEFGIVYQIEVKGKRAKSSPALYTPRTIIFSCFYPMAGVQYEDLPLDYQRFMDGTANVGTSIHLKKASRLDAPFYLYDVEKALADGSWGTTGGEYWNHQLATRNKKVGDPVFMAMKAVPTLQDGTENFLTKHAIRFDYFIRDCVFSGVKADGTQSDIQLIKRNCKTKDYHVQQLSKYGQENVGHMFMFESIAFEDAIEHYVTCDVDICVISARSGRHYWPGCYQRCDGRDWLAQDPETESLFALTTVEPEQPATAADATSAFVATAAPDFEPLPSTYAQTTTEAEPLDDLMSAKKQCLDMHWNDNFYNIKDEEIFRLCTYIKRQFPQEFQPPIY